MISNTLKARNSTAKERTALTGKLTLLRIFEGVEKCAHLEKVEGAEDGRREVHHRIKVFILTVQVQTLGRILEGFIALPDNSVDKYCNSRPYVAHGRKD